MSRYSGRFAVLDRAGRVLGKALNFGRKSNGIAKRLPVLTVLLLFFAVPGNAVFAQNLLRNGGFEIGSGQVSFTGSASGTASPAADWVIQTNNVDNVPGGSTVTATIISDSQTEGRQAISVQAESVFDGIYQKFSAFDTLVTTFSADVLVEVGQVNFLLFAADNQTIVGGTSAMASAGWQTVTFSTAVGTKGALLAAYDGASSPVKFKLDNVQLNGSASSSIPEPSSWITAICGFLLVGATLRRKGKRAAV